MTFIDRLILLLSERDITAYRLAKELDISESLISKWRKNPNTDPSASIALKISEFFQVNIEWLLIGKGEKYNKTPQKSKEYINTTYKNPIERHIIENFIQLSEEEQRKVINYSAKFLPDDLDEPAATPVRPPTKQAQQAAQVKQKPQPNPAPSPKVTPLKKDTLKEVLLIEDIDFDNEEETAEYNILDQRVSAGISNYFDENISFETVIYPVNQVPQGTDFGIRLSGDSMSPRYKDKQVVWIEETIQLNDGEIGFFIYENEAYCKQLHLNPSKKQVTLFSLNRESPDIQITNFESFRTIGRVLN